MKTDQLDFEYPDDLVATVRAPQSRVMLVDVGDPNGPRELSGLSELLQQFEPGDLLVLNDTRVMRRRVFSESGLEILFLSPLDSERRLWSVLCPSSRWKNGTEQLLPQGIRLTLKERGLPQTVQASQSLTESYFEECGDLPLPPYIQKLRGERRNVPADKEAYQTKWASHDGSLADLEALRNQGVGVVFVTLHVGLGTFLPVTVDDLSDHVMHAETAEISGQAWRAIQAAKAKGKRVWALGTTVTRTLESVGQGHFKVRPDGGFHGETRLFIQPGFDYKVVDVLMTNFHQPRSTLMALVAAFAGIKTVQSAYAWAIERKFRLFSYGDLSVWIK